VLSSSAATGNQWYLNGTSISGATGQTYTALASGAYTVQVTQNGCSAVSVVFNHTVTAIVSPSAWNGDVNAYPNPADQNLFIKNNGPRKLQVQLVDIFGKNVYEGRLTVSTGVIDIHGLAAGVYQLLLTDLNKRETITLTIIKQ
jgi:hypothetical protein